MLSVYARHYSPCLHRDRYFRDCQCPKWLQGTLWPAKTRVRRSAKTRNWKTAEQRARALEHTANESAVVLNSVTIEGAARSAEAPPPRSLALPGVAGGCASE